MRGDMSRTSPGPGHRDGRTHYAFESPESPREATPDARRGPPKRTPSCQNWLQDAHIERHTRTEGGRERPLLDVATLRRARLRALHLVEHGGEVLAELLGGEAGLADHEVHVRVLVD